ncbi:VCBS repeat-containing protein [Dyella sp. EPa41]|uniref:FG-GAP repeat domain-containing protein n=1 Tax=Dyella sp. EPa41 TaxID=1561194 RepID=UPI001915D7EA|nr:VCBS repeat-containing protein [Dyella sp. EPa41]
MPSRFCRYTTLIIAGLFGFGVAAETISSRGSSLATVTLSNPYSPAVNFGNLPALQPSTPVPGSSYVPGDFNGDGTSDLLWFNPALSQVGYWTMSATVVQSPYSGGGVTRTGLRTFNVTPGYFVGAVGDFDHDGYSDLVFTSARRDLWLWTNNRNGGWTSTQIGSYPDAWQLVGAGDVDGDGYDDLLWLDPSDCQFAYWTMRGATRTGYRIIPVACGYYPLAIGYFTPTNRLSILWTSPAHDLYIWDSTPSGFISYDLTALTASTDPSAKLTAIGGGFLGTGIGLVWSGTTTDGYTQTNQGFLATRQFDAQGNQTGFVMRAVSGGSAPVGSGGYLIQGNGTNSSALYFVNQGMRTISTGGLPNGTDHYTGNAPSPWLVADSWTYPYGWWVVGAPINGTVAPPWL